MEEIKETIKDNKMEISFIIIVLLVIFWYYHYFYSQNKKLSDCLFPKPTIVYTPPTTANVEEFSPINNVINKFSESDLKKKIGF